MNHTSLNQFPDAPWWLDFAAAELVRRADGRRWKVEQVPLLMDAGEVDVPALDAWVLAQPALDP